MSGVPSLPLLAGGSRPGSRVPSSSRPRSRDPSQGFTLIELLVALVIFATMAAIAYSGLTAVTRSHAALDQREHELAEFGRGLGMIERDLRSLANRPVRDRDGSALPPLLAEGGLLELSTYGRGRIVGRDLGLIERSGYGLGEGGVFRLRWPVLDRAQGTVPERRDVIADVSALRWRFLASDSRWHDRWPVPHAPNPDTSPRGVELILVHETLGEIRKLIELPEVAQP